MDAFVAEHLQGVSRTYALVVPMLPAPLNQAVGLAYLLMRVVDTIEDTPGFTPPERERAFSQVEAALEGRPEAVEALAQPLGETDAERALLVAAPALFKRLWALPEAHRAPIADCARAMMFGVRKLLARSAQRGRPYPAVQNADELREYCYYVAGVVGEMLCALKADYLGRPEWLRRREQAVDLGLGLQLVNILKDAPQDARHGRRYLPLVECADASAADIYDQTLELARRCLRNGVDYVLGLPSEPPGLRMFCGLPIAWGGMTLARAEHDSSAAKIDRAAVGASIERFSALVERDEALRAWLGGLLDSRSRQCAGDDRSR